MKNWFGNTIDTYIKIECRLWNGSERPRFIAYSKMRKTKHNRRVAEDRIGKARLDHSRTPTRLPVGGALYVHHYTGKVHYL